MNPLSSMDQRVGPLQLLILQGTPFCNINCRYCYLPDRSSRRRMSLATVEKTVERALEANIVGASMTVVWHAGEPLVIDRKFYAEATRLIGSLVPAATKVRHTIQTNGTLIDERWCELFLAQNFRVGLSLDGPAFIHDAARRTRQGNGTFDKTFKALKLLQATGVEHYVLAVLTATSLKHPDEMFCFFASNGVRNLGFNVEEIEGENRRSTLEDAGSEEAFIRFADRLYDLCMSQATLQVREFRALESFLLNGKFRTLHSSTQQTNPYRILSVNCEGGFATFSPELLGLKDGTMGDFVLGNVHSTDLRSALNSPKGHRLLQSILRGKELCARTCSHFPVCGGGSPSNKFSENGSFESTETLQCRLRIKGLTSVLLKKLEQRYPAVSH